MIIKNPTSQRSNTNPFTREKDSFTIKSSEILPKQIEIKSKESQKSKLSLETKKEFQSWARFLYSIYKKGKSTLNKNQKIV